MSRKVVDVSTFNGTLNWAKIKGNIDGVIIRAGYRAYRSGTLEVDVQFRNNIDGCTKNSIPFGVYWFDQDKTEAEAIDSANYVVSLVKGYKLSYPIYYDVEYSNANANGRADQISKAQRTKVIIAFCKQIKKLGYTPGIYASSSWFRGMIDYDSVKEYNIWVAQYNKNDGKVGDKPTLAKYDMWQYSSVGSVTNLSSKCDVNLDYTAKLSTTETSAVAPTKTVTEIANEVIAGKWGNGSERKTALIASGYDYDEVQKKVTEIVMSTSNTTTTSSRQVVVDQIKSWVGLNEKDGSHMKIINIYNTLNPLPRGVKMISSYSWCAATVSAVAIATKNTKIMACECSCTRMIAKYKDMDSWVEDDAYVPSPGDVIFYCWTDDGKGDCTKDPDHVGIIEKVVNGKITIIEGNMSDSSKKTDVVGRREILVNSRYIRGYAVPKYANDEKVQTSTVVKTKTVAELAQEVLNGEWGNGDARKDALTKAGYDYEAVQKKVSELLSTAAPNTKSVAVVAQEVLDGKWGNGDARKTALKKAGYDPDEVQKKVNALLTASNKKSVTEIAKEVIAGKWGDGEARKTALKKAGYDPDEVQKKVNSLL